MTLRRRNCTAWRPSSHRSELGDAVAALGSAREAIDETIVIDRPPCGISAPGDWTCDATLDDWLPPGATLTVVDRDGNRYTYRGTEDP